MRGHASRGPASTQAGPVRPGYASMLDALALGADGVLIEVSGAGVTGVTGVAATSKAFLLRLRWRLPCRDMCSLSLGDVDLLPELPRQRKAPANRVQRFRKGCSPQLSLRRPSS